MITRGLLRRLPGDRARTRAALYTHPVCVHGIFAVTSSREQHTRMTDGREEKKQETHWRRRSGGRRNEKQKEKATVMMHNTMRYGSQKIRDADTRARHVSSRINEGCVHFSRCPSVSMPPLSSCLLLAREICCESVGTLTRADQRERPRVLGVVTPLIA